MPTRSFAEIFRRHRGPYSLIVWRTFKQGDKVTITKKELERSADPEADAKMFLTDPRDCVTSVDVWSEKEEQFVTTVRREDCGIAPIMHVIEDPPMTTSTTTAKPVARSGHYVVANPKFDPGKGEVATKMWQAFLKMDGAFTAKQVATRFKSLDAKMVGPYASHFKRQGGLKAASA